MRLEQNFIKVIHPSEEKKVKNTKMLLLVLSGMLSFSMFAIGDTKHKMKSGKSQQMKNMGCGDFYAKGH